MAPDRECARFPKRDASRQRAGPCGNRAALVSLRQLVETDQGQPSPKDVEIDDWNREGPGRSVNPDFVGDRRSAVAPTHQLACWPQRAGEVLVHSTNHLALAGEGRWQDRLTLGQRNGPGRPVRACRSTATVAALRLRCGRRRPTAPANAPENQGLVHGSECRQSIRSQSSAVLRSFSLTPWSEAPAPIASFGPTARGEHR